MVQRAFAVTLFSLLALFTLQAQSRTPQPASAVPADFSSLPVQRVGPDDLLTIAVADCPELTRNFRVSADGSLSLPLLKKKLPVVGLYTPEIEKVVADELMNEKILVSPVVSVFVAEFRSVPVSVLGAVRHPVTFQAVGDVTLLDAITRADGLADDAGSEILVSRTHPDPDAGPADSLVRRIPVRGLLDDSNPALNIRLYGGEEVRVPQAGRVFVLGNVKKSGAFPMGDNGDLSVMKIVAESEGLTPYASKQAYIYRKEAGKNGRSEIPIELKDILQRKAPDVQLQANDILYIPDDKHRRLTEQTLERIAGFGIATASGYVIFH